MTGSVVRTSVLYSLQVRSALFHRIVFITCPPLNRQPAAEKPRRCLACQGSAPARLRASAPLRARHRRGELRAGSVGCGDRRPRWTAGKGDVCSRHRSRGAIDVAQVCVATTHLGRRVWLDLPGAVGHPAEFSARVCYEIRRSAWFCGGEDRRISCGVVRGSAWRLCRIDHAPSGDTRRRAADDRSSRPPAPPGCAATRDRQLRGTGPTRRALRTPLRAGFYATSRV